MINGGKGLAIDKDGITILVHGALPGETVTLKNSDKKRNHKTADVQAVVSANTQRIVPPVDGTMVAAAVTLCTAATHISWF